MRRRRKRTSSTGRGRSFEEVHMEVWSVELPALETNKEAWMGRKVGSTEATTRGEEEIEGEGEGEEEEDAVEAEGACRCRAGTNMT